MISTKKILTGLLISTSTFLCAQKLHFGSAGGLNITTSATSALAGSSINTTEGCAEIVDELTGQVIMYTDGKNIWNTNHVLQSNALLNTGWNSSQLAGLQSSTHAALIAPIPQTNNTQFFVFTTTSGNAISSISSGSGYGPLRVSIARVQSGTMPNLTFTVDVADKNQILTPAGVIVGEKIAITSDGNCGYWVTTDGVGTYGGNADDEAPLYVTPPATSPAVNINGLGKFYAYHITGSTTTISQLKSTLVQSSFSQGGHKSWGHSYTSNNGGGPVDHNMTPGEYTISRGQMKFNSNGTRLACALTNQQEIQLYDFDKTTGLLSSQILLNDACFGGYGHVGTGCYSEALPYGIEFSPNSQYIYVSTLGNVTNQGLYQFDITSGNETTIGASRNVLDYIAHQASPYYGGMHLGIDGKIYVATYGFGSIGRIPFPNNQWGTSNSLPNTIIGGYPGAPMQPISISGSCRLTLPTVVNGSPTVSLTCTVTAPTSICSGNPITVTGSWSGNIPVQYHCWILEECDVNGIANGGYNSGFLWQTGSPSTFTFPGSENLPCNKYYRVKLALQNLNYCTPWVETYKVVKYNCTPNAIASASENPVCIGGCVTLSNIATQPAGTATANTWYINSGGTDVLVGSGSPVTLCNITSATTYILKTNTKPGCIAENSIAIQVKTCGEVGRLHSINNSTDNTIDGAYKLSIFPNPSNGLLNVTIKNAADKQYSIEVFDVFGKLIYKDQLINSTGSEFNTEINLTSLNLSNGLYLINVNSESQKTSQRIVIEK